MKRVYQPSCEQTRQCCQAVAKRSRSPIFENSCSCPELLEKDFAGAFVSLRAAPSIMAEQLQPGDPGSRQQRRRAACS